MTQETADNALEEQELPSEQAPSEPEAPSPETAAADREREIQRHLSQQGRELAEARRRADAAQAIASAQAAQLGQLEANIRLLTEHLNEQQRQQAQARQAQIEAELASLPEDRLERKIEMLQGQITEMRTAAPQAQPAPPQPAPPPQPTPQQGAGQQAQEDPTAYLQRRVQEIQKEAQDEFGVLVTTDEVPDDAWGTEDAFYKSVMKLAAQKSRANGGDMPSKPKAETQEQLRERIRQEERERLGVNSPAAPKAAPASNRNKAPTGDDVRAQVQGYNSALGPKANVQKLKELREKMHG